MSWGKWTSQMGIQHWNKSWIPSTTSLIVRFLYYVFVVLVTNTNGNELDSLWHFRVWIPDRKASGMHSSLDLHEACNLSLSLNIHYFTFSSFQKLRSKWWANAFRIKNDLPSFSCNTIFTLCLSLFCRNEWHHIVVFSGLPFTIEDGAKI